MKIISSELNLNVAIVYSMLIQYFDVRKRVRKWFPKTSHPAILRHVIFDIKRHYYGIQSPYSPEIFPCDFFYFRN